MVCFLFWTQQLQNYLCYDLYLLFGSYYSRYTTAPICLFFLDPRTQDLLLKWSAFFFGPNYCIFTSATICTFFLDPTNPDILQHRFVSSFWTLLLKISNRNDLLLLFGPNYSRFSTATLCPFFLDPEAKKTEATRQRLAGATSTGNGEPLPRAEKTEATQ